MDKEIAIKLRDLKIAQHLYKLCKGNQIGNYHTEKGRKIYIPNLSELINEVGDNFNYLRKFKSIWIATSLRPMRMAVGSTKLNAVALLLIEIKKI